MSNQFETPKSKIGVKPQRSINVKKPADCKKAQRTKRKVLTFFMGVGAYDDGGTHRINNERGVKRSRHRTKGRFSHGGVFWVA